MDSMREGPQTSLKVRSPARVLILLYARWPYLRCHSSQLNASVLTIIAVGCGAISPIASAIYMPRLTRPIPTTWWSLSTSLIIPFPPSNVVPSSASRASEMRLQLKSGVCRTFLKESSHQESEESSEGTTTLYAI